ncbi:MAG: helix-turn-helix domain-containing protein [Chloroflexi bacterium]|nr:helix-turn-helix domain-containing protein [Chloroflexota bacterium]
MENDNLELSLERDIRELEKHPDFIAEGLAIGVIEEMLRILQERGLSRSWLAKQMGVSRSSVSRMMNAPPNMTLLTIARIALALGTTPDVSLNAKTPSSGPIERIAASVAEPPAEYAEYKEKATAKKGRRRAPEKPD